MTMNVVRGSIFFFFFFLTFQHYIPQTFKTYREGERVSQRRPTYLPPECRGKEPAGSAVRAASAHLSPFKFHSEVSRSHGRTSAGTPGARGQSVPACGFVFMRNFMN